MDDLKNVLRIEHAEQKAANREEMFQTSIVHPEHNTAKDYVNDSLFQQGSVCD